MYEAKAAGKGRFAVFHPSMGTAVLERHGLKEELRLALERNELALYFQPIIALATGHQAATEALVRWQHPRRGLVGPAEFVPLAEETGLILSLGEWVLEEACARADARAPHPAAVHVNLSAVELRDRRLAERVSAVLERSRLDPGMLVFEITESVLLDDPDSLRATMQSLRELGVRFALDDFGTGYSSLSYLHTLPLDMLKIAKSFVDGVGRGGREASFVRMIIELARTLGISVIAEGIETPEQAAALVALGCEHGQGFHLAKPRPAQVDAGLDNAA
jgi:EAL domain-containing protein (putative c-di-GMP-specific phosphodiesterase class I)